MAENIDKPDVSEVWASNADPDDIFNPDVGGGSNPPIPGIPGKTEKGWEATDIPPHQYFNYEQNRQGEFNSHVNIEGTPVWDENTPYIESSLAKDPTDRRVYRSLEGTVANPNQGNQPSLNLDKWKKQIETELEIVVTPTNVSPINSVEVVDTTPTLTASDFRTILNVAHGASEFRVARDAAMTDLIALSGTLGAVTTWDVTPALATGDDYYWDVRYQNADGTWSERSTSTGFTIPEAAIQTPTNLTPTDLDTSVTDTVNLTADAFLSTPASTHVASQWQITTDVNFITIDFDSGEDAINLTSFTQAGLALNLTTYYWRVRYKSDTLGWSSFSAPFSFTTVTETIQQPTNLTPTNGTVDVGGSVQLTADAFTFIGGPQTHTASQWQAGNSDFSTVYFDSGEDAVNLETINATGYPEGTTTVYWRVRYKGSVTGFSVWSNPFTFVTKAVFSTFLTTWDGTTDGATVNSSFGLTPTDTKDFIRTSNNKAVYLRSDGSNIDLELVSRSGVSLSLSTLAVAPNGTLVSAQIEPLDDPDTFILVWGVNAVSSTIIYAAVLTISGSAITKETEAAIFSVSGSGTSSVGSLTNLGNGDRVLLSYTDDSLNDIIYRVLTVNPGFTVATGSTNSAKTITGLSSLNVNRTAQGRMAFTSADNLAVIILENSTTAKVFSLVATGNSVAATLEYTKIFPTSLESVNNMFRTVEGTYVLNITYKTGGTTNFKTRTVIDAAFTDVTSTTFAGTGSATPQRAIGTPLIGGGYMDTTQSNTANDIQTITASSATPTITVTKSNSSDGTMEFVSMEEGIAIARYNISPNSFYTYQVLNGQ